VTAVAPRAAPIGYPPIAAATTGAKGRRAAAGAVVVATLLAVVVGRLYWGFTYDDAFITYRYARSFAERGALEYNPGEAVLGTTAPGHALLLGALHRITGVSIPGLGTALSLLALLVLVGVLARSTANRPRGAFALPFLFALLLLGCRWSTEMWGAETMPAAALVVLAATIALDSPGGGRTLAAGLLVALAMCLRLDAALGALVLGVLLWTRARRPPWAFGLAAGAVLVPWLAWLVHHFGRFVPVTLAAKRSESRVMTSFDGSRAEWRWLLRTLPTASACVLLLLAVAGLAALWMLRRELPTAVRALATLLVGWVGLHELFYRLVGVPFAPWYHLLLLVLVLLCATLGAFALARLAAGALAVAPRAQPLAIASIAALALLPILVPGWQWTIAHAGRAPDPRYASYSWLAHRIDGDARPGDTLAAEEIGVLGFFTRCRVLDLAGLVTPEAVTAASRGALPALVRERDPRFFVDADAFHERLGKILAAADARARYRLVADVQHGDDPHRRLRLFERVNGAP